MKKFLILVSQAGEGCDYSIGCGLNWSFYEAPTAQEAFDKWCVDSELNDPREPYMFQYHAPGGEGEYAEVQVLELATGDAHEHFWPKFVQKRLTEIVAAEAQEKQQKDLEEYERLKAKLGK